MYKHRATEHKTTKCIVCKNSEIAANEVTKYSAQVITDVGGHKRATSTMYRYGRRAKYNEVITKSNK